jgi:fructokinase
MEKAYGGIEAGGTKFVCAAGTGPDDIRAKTRFPTTTPDETIGKAIDFFRDFMKKQPLAGIGIASFGPVGLDKHSPSYGYITTSPKPGWANIDFAGRVSKALGLPVAFDTDVNGAALGEHTWGAAKGLDNFIYLTVGTGIGGGAMVNGELVHGLVHPEMGHIIVPHDRQRDPFEGCCPYHADCLEGLASGEAMGLRWERKAEELPAGHHGWELEAEYLAAGLNDLICTLSPQRIVIGGGIIKHPGLLGMVREKTLKLLNGYVASPRITENISGYIVPPALGDLSGVLGAIGLAKGK